MRIEFNQTNAMNDRMKAKINIYLTNCLPKNYEKMKK
jgi:hypothetical protein